MGTLLNSSLRRARADVERGRGQTNPPARLLFELDPVDLIVGRLVHPGGDLVGQGAAAVSRGGQLDAVLRLLDLAEPSTDGRGQLVELFANVIRPVDRCGAPGR